MFEIFSAATLSRLFDGLWLTLFITLVSMAVSLACGFALGFAAWAGSAPVRAVLRICLEFVRVMPLIVWLFVMYFGFSRWFGLNLSNVGATIIVFSIWGSFEMMELVRAALSSIPLHQTQTALALSLSRAQIFVFVVAPQALLRLIPATMNLFTRLLKSTPFAFLIGVVELLKVGQQIIELHRYDVYAPILVYGVIFWLYFLLCYPVSLYSKRLERKWKI
ncbi:MAG: amino acid ABC transporter permease [Helicobacter sp.]|nr:amino acid ABC transporter permease [Helicobacter sp.]